jgi:uncharacterized BrkB/YihY/UPF0761 family membrane protein
MAAGRPGCGATIMDRVPRILQAIDRFQQRYRWLAFGVASWKKFSDDQAGNLAVGLIFTFLGARGVAGAAQNALNTAWGVPITARPGFPWDLIRSVSLILVVGIGQIITVILSGIAGGTADVIAGLGGHVATIAASLLLIMGLFWAGFRLATAGQIATRDLRLGAFIAAGAWQVLQLAGSYIVGHELSRSSSLYGVFGLVLGAGSPEVRGCAERPGRGRLTWPPD